MSLAAPVRRVPLRKRFVGGSKSKARLSAFLLLAGIAIGAGALWRASEQRGGWRPLARFVRRTVRGLPPPAVFIHPKDGAKDADLSRKLEWTAVDEAQAYYLYVGTSAGSKDLVDSSEIQGTSYAVGDLPLGVELYARIHTKYSGVWDQTDIRFTTGSSPIARLTYPAHGTTGVDTSRPFEWTRVRGAESYSLSIGSTPGAGDIFQAGPLQATRILVPPLPSGRILYARLRTALDSRDLYLDAAFTRGEAPAGSGAPLPDLSSGVLGPGEPFRWSSEPLHEAYRLQIGSRPGAHDLYDSGEILIPRQFVRGLPEREILYGRLGTRMARIWTWRNFRFRVIGGSSVSEQVRSALWATGLVRQMASPDNRPISWTVLGRLAARRGLMEVACTDYSIALQRVLQEMNLGLESRLLNVCVNSVLFDCHTLVELSPGTGGPWILLDPTFGLTLKRADGEWASAEEVSRAVRARRWEDIRYEFLWGGGNLLARGHYLDYPLYYLNLYRAGTPVVNGGGFSPLSFFEEIESWPSGAPGSYAIRAAEDSEVEVAVDGVPSRIACDGAAGLSHVFAASSIAPTANSPPSLRVYRPLRFVF